MRAATWCLVVLPLVARGAAAQLPLRGGGNGTVGWQGEVGSYVELYRRAGGATGPLRPGETGRVYLNSTMSIAGMSVGLNLLATSEDGASAGYGGLPGRQNISQFGLHPVWRWGRAHLGAFSDNYTPLTWNGVQVTGAAFDLHPGWLRLGAFGGRARGAVSGGVTTGSYQRTTVGGRIGVGERGASRPGRYVDLIAVRAWDDPGSLAAPLDTTLPPNAPVPINPFAVTPQDNLVVATTAGFTFLDQRLSWRGEVAGSIHTLDRRATPLATDAVRDYPGLLRDLFTPRVGTHADVAYSSELQLRVRDLPGATRASPRSLTATLGFRRIGPGYVSLGTASLPNDLVAVDLKTSVRFRRWNAQLHGARLTDNLLGQKLATTTRRQVSSSFAFAVSPRWNTSARMSSSTMANDAVDSLTHTDYTAWSVAVGQDVTFGPQRRIESVSVDYAYQRAGDADPRRSATGFRSHTADARLTIRTGPAVKLTPSLGIARTWSGPTPWTLRATYGLAAAWRALAGRWTTTGSAARSRYSSSNIFVMTVTSRYQVTDQDVLTLSGQRNRFRDVATPLNGYREYLFSLQWSRRF